MIWYGILDLILGPIFLYYFLFGLRRVDYGTFGFHSGKHSDGAYGNSGNAYGGSGVGHGTHGATTGNNMTGTGTTGHNLTGDNNTVGAGVPRTTTTGHKV